MCQKCTKSTRIYLLTDDDAGRTAALEVFIAVLVCLSAGKCHDLGCYICTELLLAGTFLNHYIGLHLVFLKAYKLQRNNIGSLMQKLIEGVLSVGTRLTKDHRSGHIVYRLTEAVDRFTVGLHVKLLKMCRETA